MFDKPLDAEMLKAFDEENRKADLLLAKLKAREQQALSADQWETVDQKIAAAVDRYDEQLSATINTIIDEVYDQLGDLLAEEFKKTDQAIAEIRAAATDSHIAGKAVEDRVKRQLASIRKTLGTMAVDVAKANGVVTPLIRKSGDAA
jgi:hypothetical protein